MFNIRKCNERKRKLLHIMQVHFKSNIDLIMKLGVCKMLKFS